jgi:hypothetical protein
MLVVNTKPNVLMIEMKMFVPGVPTEMSDTALEHARVKQLFAEGQLEKVVAPKMDAPGPEAPEIKAPVAAAPAPKAPEPVAQRPVAPTPATKAS